MKEQDRAIGRFGLVTGLAVAALMLAAGRAAADPGDVAANQDTYKAVRNGAQELLEAKAALKKGLDIFRGHRKKALQETNTALRELDEAVRFAERNGGRGERARAIFDAERGSLAASQNKYKAIRGRAQHLLNAGRALDRGFDNFGGHRVEAIRAIHRALDQLDLAVKNATE